jgi:thiosulfate/3-mercaptopyruvate sulfurtransferase
MMPLNGQEGQVSPLQWPIPKPGREAGTAAAPEILIGVRELAGLRKGGLAVPLDVRGAALYEGGHLPGAVPAGPAEEGAGELDRLRSLLAGLGLTGKETVVLYGGGEGDEELEAMARLFWRLRWAGFTGVRILDGGLAAWRAAGGSLETGPFRRSPAPADAPGLLHGPPGGTVAVDAAWVAESLGQAGIELLDVRDTRGWERWEAPPTFAAGHIPKALPFDPRALLSAWPDPAGIRRRLGTLGPRAGDPVRLDSTFILYAEDANDPRLGLAYLLLTRAGLDARVFPGGWREWTAGGTRPTTRIVSAADLATLLKRENPGLDRDRPASGLILFDLREERDFAIGHLPGAGSLPFSLFVQILEKRVEEGWPGADRTRLPLALYCYGPECIRSWEAGAQAARLGFRNVLWFRGGIREWLAAGYPLLDSPLPKASPSAPAVPAVPEGASPGRGAARP